KSLIEAREVTQRRPDPPKQNESRSFRLLLQVRDEKAAGAVLATVGLGIRVRHLGTILVRPDAPPKLLTQEISRTRDRSVASKKNRGVVGEAKLEGIGLEACPQRVALGFFQALELEARPQRHGQCVELIVDVGERAVAHDRARAERDRDEKN